jgi:hypothetical protein
MELLWFNQFYCEIPISNCIELIRQYGGRNMENECDLSAALSANGQQETYAWAVSVTKIDYLESASHTVKPVALWRSFQAAFPLVWSPKPGWLFYRRLSSSALLSAYPVSVALSVPSPFPYLYSCMTQS